jgi:hypothetical protein
LDGIYTTELGCAKQQNRGLELEVVHKRYLFTSSPLPDLRNEIAQKILRNTGNVFEYLLERHVVASLPGEGGCCT